MTKIKKLSISILSVLLVLLFVATMVTPRAEATNEYLAHKFKKSVPLTFKLNNDIGQLSVDGFKNSCSQWNDAAGAGKLLDTFASKSYKTGFYKEDGENTVYKEENPAYEAGHTKLYRTTDPATGYLYPYEADILINIHHTFCNSTNPPNGYYDAQTVMIHELGHVLGLAHPSDSFIGTSVMQPVPAYGGACRRNLTSSDKNAAKTRPF